MSESLTGMTGRQQYALEFSTVCHAEEMEGVDLSECVAYFDSTVIEGERQQESPSEAAVSSRATAALLAVVSISAHAGNLLISFHL